jgi:hypothetical protein
MDERERWQWSIGALMAAALVLFLLIVILNAGSILVGLALQVFQIAVSVLAVALVVAFVWWLAGTILNALANAEDRIRNELEAMRRTLLRATNKFGADFLAFVTGGLALVIQETLADYPRLHRISIALLFAIVFFLAAQLIGSERMSERLLGIVFFLAPVASFFAALWISVPEQAMSTWLAQRSLSDRMMLLAVIVSTLLTFGFAFLKSRELSGSGPAA